MRTRIMIGLVALVLTACASKEHPTVSQQQKQDTYQHLQSKSEYRQMDGGRSQIR